MIQRQHHDNEGGHAQRIIQDRLHDALPPGASVGEYWNFRPQQEERSQVTEQKRADRPVKNIEQAQFDCSETKRMKPTMSDQRKILNASSVRASNRRPSAVRNSSSENLVIQSGMARVDHAASDHINAPSRGSRGFAIS